MEGFKITGTLPKKDISPGDTINPEDLITEEDIKPEEIGLPSKEEQEENKRLCPRCGWDTQKTEIAEISEADTREFVRCLFSRGKKRYSKDFDIAGGSITFTFRTVSPAEVDLIIKQLRQDTSKETLNRRVYNDVDRFEIYMRYRLVCSLVKFSTPDDMQEFEVVEECKLEPTDGDVTILPELYKKMAFNSQELFLLGEKLSQFENEVNTLTQRVRRPDFISPTVG
jgi:hypothetical protein